MGGIKNLIMGFITLAYYIATMVVLPLMLFKYIDDYSIAGTTIGIQNIDIINYWITVLGILISAVAFFAASSPSRSARKGVMGIVQIIINTCYIYMYKFSGATNLVLNLTGDPNLSGFLSIDFTNLIYLWMGAYALSILIAVVNLLDYVLYKEVKKNEPPKSTDKKDIQQLKAGGK
jgi:hypothetical protein